MFSHHSASLCHRRSHPFFSFLIVVAVATTPSLILKLSIMSKQSLFLFFLHLFKQQDPIAALFKNMPSKGTISPNKSFVLVKSAMDFDMAHYLLTESTKDKENEAVTASPSKEAYKKHLVKTLLLNRTRILAFKRKPSAAADGIFQEFYAVETIERQTFEDYIAALKGLTWCPFQSHLLAYGSGVGDHYIKF
ncbi:hypothetical protein ACLOJK_039054 [Asimina triloba]